MEDTEIVELFLARDEKAVTVTAAKYGKSLRKIARNICSSEPDAEECENDTYLSAWNSIPPHEPRDYFFAYLAKIVRAKALNVIKARETKKRKALFAELSDELEECVAGTENVESVIDSKELSKAVSDFLRTLSKEKRIVFLRRYWFFDSVSDISLRLGFSEGKVKTILHRTRNELRAYLGKEGWKI